MPAITTRFRCWGLLLALLTLGACQRTSYSFQAPTNTWPAPAVVIADSNPAPSLVAPGPSGLALEQVASRLRPTSVAARHLPKPQARLRLLPRLAPPAVALRPAPRQAAGGQEPTPGVSPTRWRTKGIALLLAFFLGGVGAHLFYLGYYGRAIAYLIAAAVGLVVLTIAFVLAIAAILGGGGGFVALATIGAIISGAVSLLAMVDAVRIATGDLKPKNGEYYPRFFQTRDTPPPQPTR
jgi:TM2 domain-containing membrane protein YozV